MNIFVFVRLIFFIYLRYCKSYRKKTCSGTSYQQSLRPQLDSRIIRGLGVSQSTEMGTTVSRSVLEGLLLPLLLPVLSLVGSYNTRTLL